MKPATAIVCGQIRNPGMLFLQVTQLVKFRAEGLIDKIIFSTWRGELDRHPDASEAILKLGATVIESDEPSLTAPGHVLHQSKSLMLALADVPNDGMVIKMRPDIMILEDHYRPILSGEATSAQRARRTPTLFSHPVWIHNGMPFYPFYFNDIVYYGTKIDLMKIADVDLKAELFYSGMMPEQFFHLAPVLPNHALMRAFARIQRFMAAGDGPSNAAYARELLKSDFWYRVWALSIRLLLDNYSVGFETDAQQHSEATLASFARFRLEDMVEGRPGIPGVSYYPVAAASQFTSSAWAVAAMTGRFAPSEARDRLSAAFAKLDTEPEFDNPIYPDPEAIGLSKNLQALFSEYRPKISLSHHEDQRRVVSDGVGRLSLAGTDGQARELRETINALRRENERLLMERSQRGR